MTELQRAILSTIAYFDIFDHPLRLEEIHWFLPLGGVTMSAIRVACAMEPLNAHVAAADNLYFLSHRSERVTVDRHLKERRARRMWVAARAMSHVIRRFPFVRGVFVSGELSKGIASRHSDIDFFIVTAENRVWICRSLLALFKKVFLFNRKTFLCYNLITSEHNLRIDDRNIYTAVEVVTVKPLFNETLFREFLHANSWTSRYLPNASDAAPDAERLPHRPFLAERALTQVVSAKKLYSIDQWLFRKWQNVWKERYRELSSEALERQFQCRRDLSTAYVGDYRHNIMDRYRQRLRTYGIVHFDKVSV
jgi:hypothetical protein